MKTYRAFEVAYIPATNTRGSRVLIFDCKYNKSKRLPYDYKFNDSLGVALDYMNKLGMQIIGKAEHDNGHIIFTEDFLTVLK